MRRVYFGSNVFHCQSKRFEENMSIICTDGRIEALVRGRVQPAPDMEFVDISGKWTIPGLVNVHEHQTYKRLVGPLFGPGGSFFQVTEAELTMRAVRSALYALRHGVTTVFEAGARGDVPFAMRRSIEKGFFPGPRMYIAGAALSITGGHGCELCHEVDTPDEMRRQVRLAFKQGVDGIKLLASEEPVAESNAYGEPVIAELSEEMIRAAVEEAHRVHRRVFIHGMGVEQLTRSIRGGVDVIHHGAFLNREMARQMREQGITLVPTLSSYRLTAHPRFARGETWSREHRALWPAFDAAVQAALEEGVSIAIGTDSVGDFRHEMQMLHRRGMTREDCLVAATWGGAKAIGADRIVGSIEAGKSADLAVLNQNPLDDLAALNSMALVVREGVPYQPETLRLPALSGEQAFVEAFALTEEWM